MTEEGSIYVVNYLNKVKSLKWLFSFKKMYVSFSIPNLNLNLGDCQLYLLNPKENC